jgi:hypothetical protein
LLAHSAQGPAPSSSGWWALRRENRVGWLAADFVGREQFAGIVGKRPERGAGAARAACTAGQTLQEERGWLHLQIGEAWKLEA